MREATPGESRQADGNVGDLLSRSRGGGRPMSATTRTFMETRFSHDFDDVRIHTDGDAAQMTKDLHAEAFTYGRDIYFQPDKYFPQTSSGKRLLAHELMHVAQQSLVATPGAASATIQRRVSPDYGRIRSNLTYKALDWAITDREAREVLEILSRLSEPDLADTVAAMDREGLVNDLLGNVAREDEERYLVLLGRITRHRSTAHSAEWIVGRLSRGLSDWMITDDDARQALHALMGLESQELRTVVGNMVNEGVFDRLEAELPEEERRRFPAFLARLRSIRDEFQALAAAHAGFLHSQADEDADNGDVSRKKLKKDVPWKKLKDEERDEWQRRADAVITDVIESVRGTDLEPILSRSELVFEPEDVENRNGYASWQQGTNKLFFARNWVRDAEANPLNVWQNIAHELGGHQEFGTTWSWEIMRAALNRLTPAEHRQAFSSVASLYKTYGEPESELYAELRELPWRVSESGGDKPETDVPEQLRRIKQAFGPDVGRQIVMRLYYRVMTDPRVSTSARNLLYSSVQSVFGLFPIAGAIAP